MATINLRIGNRPTGVSRTDTRTHTKDEDRTTITVIDLDAGDVMDPQFTRLDHYEACPQCMAPCYLVDVAEDGRSWIKCSDPNCAEEYLITHLSPKGA